MHIPDGFVGIKTAAAAGVFSLAGLAFAVRTLNRELPRTRVPLIGLAAAFIFAAQMLNFPVAGGTSGHLIGAALAVVLVGPAAAVVVMTSVLILQCFLFADGGVTALGANIVNMAIVAPLTAWAAYSALGGRTAALRARLAAATFAAWCSTVVASLACAVELALSGTAAWGVVLPAMLGVHMLIGVGEAVITALVVAAVARARPGLVASPTAEPPASFAAAGFVAAMALALFASPFASSFPDGLEKVAERLGFAHAALEPVVASPIPDYAMPGVASAIWATAWAGGIGTILAFALAWILARSLARPSTQRAGA